VLGGAKLPLVVLHEEAGRERHGGLAPLGELEAREARGVRLGVDARLAHLHVLAHRGARAGGGRGVRRDAAGEERQDREQGEGAHGPAHAWAAYMAFLAALGEEVCRKPFKRRARSRRAGPLVRRGMLLALALLLVAPSLALTPAADACAAVGLQAGVPCGRIYPVITINSASSGYANLTPNLTVTLDATLDFSFKMLGEGYAPVPPTDPITITFEFPRKPAWVDMSVEPDSIPVDVNDPTHMQPDPANPAGPEITYDYQVPIKVHVTLVGQAVLRDGFDYAKLLLFAKSSENGLYQSGYGIKEFRAIPAGAIHESDVAQDRYATVPLPAFTLKPATAEAAGERVTLTPPSSGPFWQPQKFAARIDPAPAGKVVAALHDEWGDLVYATQPLDASSGQVAFTATLAKPGLHTATFAILPDPGSAAPPVTIPVSFVAGDVSPEGYAYPKDYAVVDSAVVGAPNGNTGDALAQVERDVPLFAFDNAQSVTATITLETPGQALDKGAASLNMLLLDPEGKVLQTAAADPVTYPQRTLRIGSVPEEGWYT